MRLLLALFGGLCRLQEALSLPGSLESVVFMGQELEMLSVTTKSSWISWFIEHFSNQPSFFTNITALRRFFNEDEFFEVVIGGY